MGDGVTNLPPGNVANPPSFFLFDNSWEPGTVSWCFTLIPGVPHCFLVFHNVFWYFNCFLVFHTVSWCFKLFPGVTHCFLLFHIVSWCFTLFLVFKCRESRTFDSAEFVVNHALLV